MLCGAACSSQTILVVMWLVFGRTPCPLRVVVLVIVIATWSMTMASLNLPSAFIACCLVITAFLASLPMWLMRWCRWQVVAVTGKTDDGQVASAPCPFQYSIRYLLAWMTAVAIISSICHYVFTSNPAWPPLLEHDFLVWSTIGINCCIVALPGVPLLWALLGTASLRWRISVGLSGVLLTIVLDGIRSLPHLGVNPIIIMIIAMALPLFVVRIAGYRFARRRKTKMAAPE